MTLRTALFMTLTGLGSLCLAQGNYLPCDSTVTVSIQSNALMGGNWGFQAVIDSGNLTALQTTWTFNDGSPIVTNSTYADHEFSGPGTYLVCFSLIASDGLNPPCEVVSCELVVVEAPGCPGTQPEFTASVAGDTVFFQDLTVSNAMILSTLWDLGDGSFASGAPPIHVFSSNGPYQVCLTVTTLDSLQQTCTSTICHWFYSGPIDPPCSTLLAPSFVQLVQGDHVALLNTSVVSGLNAQYVWDLGDGTIATGENILHQYASPGSYSACLTVTVTGTLLTDSCVAQTCATIELVTLSVPGRVRPDLHVWPVPTDRTIHFRVPEMADDLQVQVIDASGRILLQWSLSEAPGGLVALDLTNMTPGMHLLRLIGGGTVYTARIVVH